ncbi:hypothetical protein GCM10007094_23310 [Pseudovibrio japonicus]|uniref:Uncharacterized protein n=1 Tax=Pseudovibrio japonicus TaxID=366534 RepID=A0ABQ3EEH1_9HYPH|nr:hypothetical protein [Pseudovibrio japonicus]GHB33783.1 hypothetical protein GCM10007094_23310 [Pseudovibrio japonicus]
MDYQSEDLSIITTPSGQYAVERIVKGSLEKTIDWTNDLSEASVWPSQYITALTADWDLEFAILPAREERTVALDTSRMVHPSLPRGGRIPAAAPSLVGESSTGFLISNPERLAQNTRGSATPSPSNLTDDLARAIEDDLLEPFSRNQSPTERG